MKCAIYCRLSKEDGNTASESESIFNQKNMLMSYAAEKTWEVYGIYCDDDYSGADPERPGFRAMLEAAREKRFDVILCKTQSRFTRDLEMVEKYIHKLFPIWGIRFVAVLDNIDTEAKGNKKARQINGLVNEWYLEDLSENIRAVFEQKRRAGKYLASFAVYGYKKDPQDHNRLLIDGEAAGIVREIFSMYLSGLGTHEIAESLNTRGILPPMGYRLAKTSAGAGPYMSAGHSGGLRAKSGGWSATAVSRILKNEVYLGTTVQGRTRKQSYKSKKCVSVPQSEWVRAEHTHEAIIDKAVFKAASRRLAAHTRSDGRGEVYPLAGKLFCADCGGGFIKVSHKYNGAPKAYLQCKGYAANRKNPVCSKHSVKLCSLEAEVGERIRELVRKYYNVGDLSRFKPQTLVKDEGMRIKKELIAAGQRLERLSSALRSLYLDKVDGEISAELFKEMSAGILAEKSGLESRIEALEQILRAAPYDERVNPRGIAVRIDALLELKQINRLLCDLFINKIEINEKVMGSQNIKIYWKV